VLSFLHKHFVHLKTLTGGNELGILAEDSGSAVDERSTLPEGSLSPLTLGIVGGGEGLVDLRLGACLHLIANLFDVYEHPKERERIHGLFEDEEVIIYKMAVHYRYINRTYRLVIRGEVLNGAARAGGAP